MSANSTSWCPQRKAGFRGRNELERWMCPHCDICRKVGYCPGAITPRIPLDLYEKFPSLSLILIDNRQEG